MLLALAAARGAEPGLVDAPLAPRSGPRGATLFTKLAPEQTGIVTENNFTDPKMWNEHYQELIFGEVGTGIAIGDYDGDGRPDVFVVSKTEPCRLFRNLGNWKFEDVTAKAGLGGATDGWIDTAKGWIGLGGDDAAADTPDRWKQGATFVDVNNDGWLDIYVCRFGAPNLLYINQGDGTFKEEAAARGLAVTDDSCMAAFCDYDRDGWLDVFIHTNMLDAATHPNGRRSYLFHNNGDGTFTNVTDRAGILGDSSAHSATWWDYDDDGWPDLYVANDYAGADVLYHNNRDGTFTNVINRVVPHTPYYAMGADLGDVNNDGRIDLFVADMAATTHEKDFRGMAVARGRTQANPPDPAIAPQYMHSALYLNTGTGHMLEAAWLAGIEATDWTWSPRWEDLDDDGRLDLFVTNGMIREYNNIDLLAKSVARENIAAQRAVVKQSPPLAEMNVAFRNLGNLQFQNVSKAWGLDERGVSFGSAFGDLDGDGDLDLVYANYEGGVTVMRNDSDAGHRVIVALRGTRSNRFGVGATVRIRTASGEQVRQLVLARGYLSSSEPILHFGLGEDARIERLTVAWPSGAEQVFTNLAADRRYTITEVAQASPPAFSGRAGTPALRAAVAPEFSDVGAAMNLALPTTEAPREAESKSLEPFRLDRRGPTLVAGDLDGDGRSDIVIGGTTKDPLRIVRGGKIETLITGPGEDGPMVLLDANGDGSPDLLVTKAMAARPQLFLNDGRGAFRAAAIDALPAAEIDAGAAATADFNRDGQPDVFIGARVRPGKYPLAGRSELLANRGGRFADVTDAVAPELREVGLVTAALWSDVDGDGWPDLLVACEWGNIRYFHNAGGARLEDWTEKAGFAAAGTGLWSALAVADFNGDGRPDFVAGNLGLNTPYQADARHPALLFYGNFAGHGEDDIVEAFYEGDRIYPRRSRNELGARIPAIMRRYSRNDLFARATLEEILGRDTLAKARRFAATELRSGVFLSQPDGSYRFEPLPRIAQIAPFEGIVAGDFDGDGHADIYAVQNSFAPVPAIGHFDGGLSQMLRGDGSGRFVAVSSAESGLIVPGDAKAVAALDLDGDGRVDFVVSRNNSTTLAFRNNGRAPRER
ncbi:MAG TPA: VCBS repeat-containing protein [Opitutus sp.]|nr:VCBS repeat-containing protein [Opitutus sp.]